MPVSKQLAPFMHAVSEFLAEPHRPQTSSSGHTAQNVALDAR
jgi:hypothetical protein